MTLPRSGLPRHSLPLSTRAIYELGMETIPSESECYPAKLAHGHAQWLIDQGVETIFHPCVFYEHQEVREAQNHFNCPIVVANPENIEQRRSRDRRLRALLPPLPRLYERKGRGRPSRALLQGRPGTSPSRKRVTPRTSLGRAAEAKADVRAAGAKALADMEKNGGSGIVLAGRPYHVDPEINHGIPELIAAYGLTVLTEDCLPASLPPSAPCA